MRRFPALLVIALSLAVAACAARNTASGGTASASQRDRSLIDSMELRASRASTVYDLISSTRSDWLLARGGPSGGRMPELGVWADASQRTYGAEWLKTIRPNDIRSVRRLSPTESLHSYNWPWGGLVVTTR
jgi:hypothetical protein